ncbi:MAG: helix-turn-helix domain-containing protein [Verrucomicrobiae bacterium]|nr:helix-turn-helix domain-containing protein [Verrucomicrobiae bacterium]
MSSIGETLREARHRKQVSLEEVSRATKIKIEVIEHLEADEFDRLVSPTYAKGFIRIYGDYLGLDGRALADAYIQSQGGLKRKGLQLETAAAANRRRTELRLSLRGVVALVAGLTLVAVLLVVLWAWRANSTTTATAVSKPDPNQIRADTEPSWRPPLSPLPVLDVPQ